MKDDELEAAHRKEVSAESGCSIDAMQEMIARVANYWNRRCQDLPDPPGGDKND